MKIILFWTLCIAGALASASSFAAQPNIVYILADDMGIGDVQAGFGSKHSKANNFKKQYDENLPEISPIALYNLKDNLPEDEAKNLIKNPEYAPRIEEMMATYKRMRATGEATVENP